MEDFLSISLHFDTVRILKYKRNPTTISILRVIFLVLVVSPVASCSVNTAMERDIMLLRKSEKTAHISTYPLLLTAAQLTLYTISQSCTNLARVVLRNFKILHAFARTQVWRLVI